jgi:hypothetical protein
MTLLKITANPPQTTSDALETSKYNETLKEIFGVSG